MEWMLLPSVRRLNIIHPWRSPVLPPASQPRLVQPTSKPGSKLNCWTLTGLKLNVSKSTRRQKQWNCKLTAWNWLLNSLEPPAESWPAWAKPAYIDLLVIAPGRGSQHKTQTPGECSQVYAVHEGEARRTQVWFQVINFSYWWLVHFNWSVSSLNWSISSFNWSLST